MKIVAQNQDVAMGIDVAAKHLAITMLVEGEVVTQTTIRHNRAAIESFLSRFPDCRIRAVYEAGCFGYWLCDTLRELGVMAIVTPPSLLARAPGAKVKTDRRDSLLLAEQLASGRLKAVAVPSKEERAARQLVRTYDQVKRTRKQTMTRIRSFLMLHHIEAPKTIGKAWTRRYVEWLDGLTFEEMPGGEYLRRSLQALLGTYRGLTEEATALKKEIGRLAKTKKYEKAVTVLEATPGVGTLSAMIVLTEVRNARRFPTSQEFASNLGLTPWEHSTGEQQHRGHITKAGNRHIRAVLVECAWTWIRYDKAAYAVFRRIARRREAKRAIVAMARRLAVKIYWQLRGIRFGEVA
ncbi:MAG TPA: IS110 family transposase [Candidatus Hydrogenedentes bacterium]|nr:IS110 family transposase [Candidatus Hydrogenedentota bacterium]